MKTTGLEAANTRLAMVKTILSKLPKLLLQKDDRKICLQVMNTKLVMVNTIEVANTKLAMDIICKEPKLRLQKDNGKTGL